MFKKIMVKVDNKNINELNICYALIDHRTFAKFYIGKKFTMFYLTKKEYETYNNLMKTI